MNESPAFVERLHIAGKPRRNRPFRLARNSWTFPALAFLFIFYVAPLVKNAAVSFSPGQAGAGGYLANYVTLITDAFYSGVLIETLKVSLIVTLLCLLVGYPVAFFMVRYGRRWNGVIIFCLIAPLLTSIIMRTFGWQVLFARRGLLNVLMVDTGIVERPVDFLHNSVSVYVGLVHVLVPFMVLSIAAVLQTVDIRLEEAARVLGAGRFSTFRHVTWPLSMEGVMNGAILVFVLTNGSFLTMLLLGDGSVKTIALLIYQQFNLTQNVGFASAMGNVLLVIALIGLMAQARLVRAGGER